ncbi:ATP-binding protein [Patescibacteria group bacterium]
MYNWKIIGHKKQLELIEHDIKSDRLTHAYLFTGPSSIGKFSIARMFVNILQCPNNLCHECPTCIQLEKGSHPDTITLKAEDGSESIKIEQVRDIIAKLNMTKQSKYKVLLIKKAERFTPEAANCLLKTLEEPPPHTVIIMTTDNVRELLPTIISRVRLIKFSAYSNKFLKSKMTELFPEANEETLEQVCSLALGKSGKAIKLLKNADLLASYRTMYTMLCEFLEPAPLYKKFKVIEEVLAEDNKTTEFLDVFTHLVRSRLHQGIENKELTTSKRQHLLSLLSLIENTRQLLKRNINARLALENLALKASL